MSEQPARSSAYSPQEGFALMLETACEDFENLLDLISGALQVTAATENKNPTAAARARRAAARTKMALAKSFVFNAWRANRIFKRNKAVLAIDRLERQMFLKATDPLKTVRDVNEHGFDDATAVGPSMHRQGDAILDETALTIEGPARILMGPLNLHPIYISVDRMRNLAGFAAVAKKKIESKAS